MGTCDEHYRHTIVQWPYSLLNVFFSRTFLIVQITIFDADRQKKLNK